MDKKVLKDGYVIFIALEDKDVENILVLYARENKLCKYKVDWIQEVLTCFDRRFVEPRIINVNQKEITYSYFDGKDKNDIAITIVKEDGHKKMEGKLLQRKKEKPPVSLQERG